MDKETVLREECFANHKMINDKLDKIDDKVNDVIVEVAKLPEKIIERVDEKISLATKAADDKLTSLKKESDTKFASKEGLKNVQKIVFGLVGAILLAVLYTLLKSIGLTL